MPRRNLAPVAALLLTLALGPLAAGCDDGPANPGGLPTDARVPADDATSTDAHAGDAAPTDVGTNPRDDASPRDEDASAPDPDASAADATADASTPASDASLPDASRCPTEAPDPSTACPQPLDRCTYGEECWCGQCYPSFVCTCDPSASATWLCYYTDACFGPCEREDGGIADI
ncbi:hypothetical protein L6R52_03010 [Myxococcota bacterium]|nr:hypothetical protein [Myxococcota bacterium]